MCKHAHIALVCWALSGIWTPFYQSVLCTWHFIYKKTRRSCPILNEWHTDIFHYKKKNNLHLHFSKKCTPILFELFMHNVLKNFIHFVQLNYFVLKFKYGYGPNYYINIPSKFAVFWNLRCFYSPVPESLHMYNLDFCDLIFAVKLEDPMSAKIEVKV